MSFASTCRAIREYRGVVAFEEALAKKFGGLAEYFSLASIFVEHKIKFILLFARPLGLVPRRATSPIRALIQMNGPYVLWGSTRASGPLISRLQSSRWRQASHGVFLLSSLEVAQVEDLVALGLRVVEIIWVPQNHNIRVHALQYILLTQLNLLPGDRSYSHGDHNIGFPSVNPHFLFRVL